MAEATRKEMEQAAKAAEAIEKGLTADPKHVFQVPKPGDLYVPYLTIVPGLSTLYPWVLFTASFVEENVLSFLFTGGVILFSGRYCEPMWGMTEMARFVALQTILPNIVSVLIYLVAFSASKGIDSETGDSVKLETISGAVALVSGFLVAFKQMVPEHTILLFRGAIKIRVAWLPAIYLTMYTLFELLFRSNVHFIQAWTGFFTSWVYLRFFRISYVDPLLPFSSAGSKVNSNTSANSSPLSSNNASSSNLAFTARSANVAGAQAGIKIKGDLSDSFALSQFFPEPMATAVTIVSNRVFDILVALRVCTPFDLTEVDASNMRAANRASGGGSYVMSNSNYYNMRSLGSSAQGSSGSSYMPPLGSTRAEAERRRALALQALDVQLNRHAPQTQSNTGAHTESSTVVPAPDLKMPNRAVLPQARIN